MTTEWDNQAPSKPHESAAHMQINHCPYKCFSPSVIFGDWLVKAGFFPTIELKRLGLCSWGPSQGALLVENPPASAGHMRDAGLIPGSRRSPGGGHGNPLQYSCLESPMDRGAWRAAVHKVAKSRTWLESHMTETTERARSMVVNCTVSSDWILNTRGGFPSKTVSTRKLQTRKGDRHVDYFFSWSHLHSEVYFIISVFID